MLGLTATCYSTHVLMLVRLGLRVESAGSNSNLLQHSCSDVGETGAES